MPNRLAQETSPYLLQHQDNPVDWYPWGPAAWELARTTQKPIFLSVGYSACHWCHVMEHESFENERIAGLLNAEFVSIKVDREERPEIDHIYMQAVQLLTGRGGWPMSVFLTPDLQPFFGGTYWPPESRMGLPGFADVLRAVADAWRQRRPQAIAQAAELTEAVRGAERVESSGGMLRGQLILDAAAVLARAFDPQWGGFGRAPKFPHSLDLQVLLRAARRGGPPQCVEIVTQTLDHMARGGIYDHLGGGFARYSVDERWLIPHFEKMLYDNALLATMYVEAYQVTGRADFARVARETLDYVQRDLTDAAGGFHCTEDADSEGVEGKFYAWTPAQIRAALGDARAARFCEAYGVTDVGNFEHGTSVLSLPRTLTDVAAAHGADPVALSAELAADRQTLLEIRNQRVRPGKDDKILASWNGLMIDALARAALAFDDGHVYCQAAERAARFVLSNMRRPDGRLWHCWRRGQARIAGFLDDYAALANALVSLYEASFDERWIDEAVTLAETLLKHFADRQGGGFFMTADDHESLIARPVDLFDSSVPSGNALAATALIRLGKLTGRTDFRDAAGQTLQRGLGVIERATTAAGQLLLALDLWLGPTFEFTILAGSDPADAAEVRRAVERPFLPRRVLAMRGDTCAPDHYGSPLLDPLFAGKGPATRQSQLYVCRDFACQTPAVGGAAARAIIAGLNDA